MASIATLAPPKPATTERLRLDDVPWQTYETLLRCFEGRHLRITYDRGALEIMVVSAGHEHSKKLLGRFVEALTEELNIPCYGLGNTTYRREDMARGLEADDCYYFRDEFPLQSPAEVDLNVDPPPDLALEVEVTRSALNRLGIYAALRVPEIWCTDGERLRVYVLQGDSYAEVDRSPTFPWVTPAEISSFLQRRGQVSDTQLIREFRQWVRTTVLPRRQTQLPGNTGQPG